MSSSSNLLGSTDRNTWYTMNELRIGVRDFRKENINGIYDYNISVHELALKDMLKEISTVK